MKYSAVVVASAAVALAQTVPSSNTCDQLEAIETRCNESAKADVAAHAACMCSNNQEFFTLWAKCRQQIQDAPEWLEVNSATKADLCGGSPSGLYQGVFRKITEGKGLFETNPGAAESSAPSTPSGSSLPVTALKEADAVEKDVYAEEEDDVPPIGTSFAGVDEDGVAEAEDDVLAPATTFTTSTFAPGSTGSSFGTPGTAGGAGVFGNSTHTGPTAAASTGKASSGMSFALVGAVLMLAL